MISEEERLEIINEYMKTELDYKKYKRKRNKKIFFVSLITVIVLLIIAYKLGGIYIPWVKKYVRYYEVKLNEAEFPIDVSIEETVIIPKVLYLANGQNSFTFSNSDIILPDQFNKYKLSIDSYNCYYNSNNKKYKTDCENKNNKILEKNNDTKYKLKILSYTKYDSQKDYESLNNNFGLKETKNYQIIYNDIFISDITPYIEKEGIYLLSINAKYGFTNAIIECYLINDGCIMKVLNI